MSENARKPYGQGRPPRSPGAGEASMNVAKPLWWLAFAASLTLVACQPAGNSTAADSNATSGEAANTPSAHHWLIRDGQEYGYSSALSENDQLAGRGASDVIMFRYLGVTNGIYKLASLQGTDYFVTSCKNPCSVIKYYANADVSALTKYITFNPDTVIGEALTDAFNGQLEVYGSTPPGQSATTAPPPPPPPPPPAAAVADTGATTAAVVQPQGASTPPSGVAGPESLGPQQPAPQASTNAAGQPWTTGRLLAEFGKADAGCKPRSEPEQAEAECHYRDNLARALVQRGLCWSWPGGQPNGQRVWLKCAGGA